MHSNPHSPNGLLCKPWDSDFGLVFKALWRDSSGSTDRYAILPHFGCTSVACFRRARDVNGRTTDREELLSTVLEDLGHRYAAWREGGLDAVYDGLGPRDFLRGRRVTVDGSSGVVTMIDREGVLEVAVGHGEIVKVSSGEVTYAR